MKLTEMFLAEMDREAPGTRKALERVPDGAFGWKPHEKSMTMGQLAGLVAGMPGWVDLMISLDEFDVNPVVKSDQWKSPDTTNGLLTMFDASLVKGRAALAGTTDAHLMTDWRMLAKGKLVNTEPRYLAIRHGAINHMAHHRGQLTVYLRLVDASVPAIYGPSADEGRF
jgi:uncharacterized damage-inducible protein DinB